MKRIYLDRFHLYELKASSEVDYLLIKNSYPDPRSIKENVFSEINCRSDEQLEALKSNFVHSFDGVVEIGEEVGRMEVHPIGGELYSGVFSKDMCIKYILYKESPWCILGTAKSKEEFLREYDDDIEEYGGGYSRIVNEVIASFVPSSHFKEVYDIDSYFRNCSMWDYEHNEWARENT